MKIECTKCCQEVGLCKCKKLISKSVWKMLVHNTTNGSRDFVYAESKELYDAFEIFKNQFATPKDYILIAWERINVLC